MVGFKFWLVVTPPWFDDRRLSLQRGVVMPRLGVSGMFVLASLYHLITDTVSTRPSGRVQASTGIIGIRMEAWGRMSWGSVMITGGDPSVRL